VRKVLEACPSMPHVLSDGLITSYADVPADQRAALAASYASAPEWLELRGRACLASREQLAQAYPDAEAVFRVCELDRFGLSSPGRPFVIGDTTAYVLLLWLLDQRNDPERARAVVRPLLAAHGDPGALLERCVVEGVGCSVAMARRGIDLPTSTSTSVLRPGVPVTLTRDEVRIGDEVVMTLEDGRAAPEAFVHHQHPGVRAALVAQSRLGLPAEEDQRQMRRERLLLFADRFADWRTVANLMFTASAAGFSEFAIVTLSDGELHEVMVSPPRGWYEPPEGGWGSPTQRSRELKLTVDRERIEASWGSRGGKARFEARADCWDDPVACHASDALVAKLAELKADYRDETAATLLLDGAVPLQTVVTLADMLRGRGCRLNGAQMGEDVPEQCLFWQPIVDLDPGLCWLTGRLEDLQLSDATASERAPAERRGRKPSTADALKLYEDNKAAIAECILSEPALLPDIYHGARFGVSWGEAPREEGRPTQIRVHSTAGDLWPPGSVEICIAQALDGRFISGLHTSEFIGTVFTEITFGVRIEERDEPSEP
jgi:biopolymer transport protein ExbD